MVQFGEEQFGETQFATASLSEPTDESFEAVRERAETVMKVCYPTEEGTNWDKLLNTLLSEFATEYDVIAAIIDGRFINFAEGAQLGLIGAMWDVERKEGETDGHFRARIKANFSRHTSRATVQEIKNIAATILRTRRGNIYLEENFDIEPARADIWIDDTVFHDSGVTVSEFETLMNDIKPAGVKLFATIGEQFTYRSVSDYEGDVNDATRAYDGFAQSSLDLPEEGWGYNYGENYGAGYPYHTSAPAQIRDGETTLDIGAGYADEVTQQIEPFA